MYLINTLTNLFAVSNNLIILLTPPLFFKFGDKTQSLSQQSLVIKRFLILKSMQYIIIIKIIILYWA